MLFNSGPLNAAAINADLGVLNFSASLSSSVAVSATMAYQIKLSTTVQNTRSFTAVPYAVVTATLTTAKSVSGTPYAQLVSTFGRVQTIAPQFYTWMNPATFSSVLSVVGVNHAMMSATFTSAQNFTGVGSVTKFFTSTLAQYKSVTAFMAGVWNCTLASAYTMTNNMTTQLNMNLVFDSVKTLAAINSALLSASIGQVQSIVATYGVYLLPTVAFNGSIGITAVPRALLQATLQSARTVSATVTTTKFFSLTMSRQQTVGAALYSFVPPITISSAFNIRCNIAISGSGWKLGGKIARDVQRPYLGEMVS